ncbi:MAG: hypothetical protein AB3N33_10400 [Puniceicoccaceae bacterium]
MFHKLHSTFLAMAFGFVIMGPRLAAEAPSIHADASIQWEDAHFQAKPDGNLMYLVTTQGVLIETSKFNIQSPTGSTHSNRLPWEMKRTVKGNSLHFAEPVRIGSAEGYYSITTSVDDRTLRISADFTAEGYRARNVILNLPLNVYAGRQFEVDGEAFAYTASGEHPRGRKVVTLMKRRPFKQFVSSDVGGSRFLLEPKCELEIEVVNRTDWKGHRSFWVNLYSVDGRHVDYTLQLPDYEPAMWAGGRPLNYLANSSFELGREEWGVIFSKRDVSSKWSVTDETASHGEHSLKVEIVPQVAAYENKSKPATIASEYFVGNVLDQLSISADLKASVPGQKVKLQLRLVPTELVPNKGSTMIEKEITLTNQWQRFSFDARLPLAANNAYAIAVAIPATEKPAVVYLDAVTVTRKGERHYNPKLPLEVMSDTVRYHRVYQPGEVFDLVTMVRNNEDTESSCNLTLEITDWRGEGVHQEARQIDSIPANTNKRVQWDIPAFERQGMYRIQVVASSDNAPEQVHGLSLAVLRDRDVNEVDPAIRFGACITDLREFWALERIGLGWSRFTFDCAWGNLQPQRNWWNKAKEEQLSALLDYQASFGVTPLAVLGPGMPKWASRGPKGSSAFRAYTPREELEDEFVEYLNRLLEMADGRLHAIETWNEPDIPLFYRGTVSEMADFTTLSYETIKAYDPSIDVVGLGLATPAETKNKFLHKLLQQTGLGPYDAISFHPYTEGRLHPAKGEFREVVQSIGEVMEHHGEPVPLWSTEFGYFGYAHDAKPFVPFKNPFVAREIYNEQESAEAYIQAICTSFAYGVEKTFYFTLLEGNLLDRWLHGWVGPGGRSVESGFIAAAAACDIMYNVDCLGQEHLGNGTYQTRFSGPAGDFVVLWNEAGGELLTLKAPGTIKATDLYGNPFAIEPKDGVAEITASGTPVYLHIKNLKEILQ